MVEACGSGPTRIVAGQIIEQKRRCLACFTLTARTRCGLGSNALPPFSSIMTSYCCLQHQVSCLRRHNTAMVHDVPSIVASSAQGPVVWVVSENENRLVCRNRGIIRRTVRTSYFFLFLNHRWKASYPGHSESITIEASAKINGM